MPSLSKLPEYGVWGNMIQRCKNPKASKYYRYGGRGISVCERWTGESGFANFLEDMGPRPSATHTIDRTDNDGNYEPSNCVWVTRTENHRNKNTGTSHPCIYYHPRKTVDRNWDVLLFKRCPHVFYTGVFSTLEDAEIMRDVVTELRDTEGIEAVSNG